MKTFVIAILALLGSTAAMAVQDSAHALIQQGEYLARAGDCVACHTARGQTIRRRPGDGNPDWPYLLD